MANYKCEKCRCTFRGKSTCPKCKRRGTEVSDSFTSVYQYDFIGDGLSSAFESSSYDSGSSSDWSGGGGDSGGGGSSGDW